MVIFDELFKGTNVKDAYDATVAVTEAFGDNRNCTFIVSTHIVEAGETLRERGANMQFLFFSHYHGEAGATLYIPAAGGYFGRPPWYDDHHQ